MDSPLYHYKNVNLEKDYILKDLTKYAYILFLIYKTNIYTYSVRSGTTSYFLLHVLEVTHHQHGLYTPIYLKHNKI